MATPETPQSHSTTLDPHLQSDSPTFTLNPGSRHRHFPPSSNPSEPTIPNLDSSTSTGPPPPRISLPPHLPPSLLPNAPLSLSGISFRAYALGLASGSALTLLPLLLYLHSPLWRPPFFVLILSLFHYLEFHTTARYNPSVCTTSSFLLSSNGSAYNIAHVSAIVECLLRYLLLPSIIPTTPVLIRNVLLVAGLVMVAVGQTVRTLAMVEAGESFNHTVQTRRRETHQLVTSGIYGWLRHPSYFGFWWWGVGGQLVLGNWVCLVGYVVVLWGFFNGRIRKEEQLLVGFFGKEYEEYRAKTRTGIPGIP